MNNLDIVNLIEKNPITILSNTYNNKLLIKIKESFTESQQQLFIASFYCYLNYDEKNDFVIDLDNIWQWLGFSQKARSKELLIKNFINNIDYKIMTNLQKNNDTQGGHNKEIIMLNIKTFKLLCIKASTKKANEIHEYFVNLEKILQDVIKEESNELKLQLDKINLKLTNTENKLSKTTELEKEKILLREFGTIGSLVYIIKVKTIENGEYVIKIGESRKGILARYNEHKTNYGDFLLLDCFIVKRSKDFEKFIHEKIKENKYKKLIGHENEMELFLVGKKLSYSTLLHIIETNIKYYNEYCDNEVEILKLENEKLKSLININDSENINKFIQEIVNTNKILLDKINNLENIVIEEFKNNKINSKPVNNFNEILPTIGPRLQQINPDNFNLVKVYETVSELLKVNNKIKRSSLDKAIMENTIYDGFRWLYVDRSLDPNIIYNIDDTKKTKIQNLGYIAKLNSNKTEILNVYLDRKSASILNNYPSDASLDCHVKNFTITNGNYYILYDKCSNELKENFIIKNKGEPILYKDGIGQYNDKNILIKEFVCKNNCCKTLGISDKTLNKALTKNIAYNSYYYKHLASKLKCL
jgi:phage anti-repressor protein